MITNVLEYLELTAERHPDKAAFVDESKSMSFRDLLHTARAVGTYLSLKTGARKPIAVLMEKSADCLAALLGIVYASCFYVPIDSKMPEERINHIFDTLQPAGLIYDEKNRDKLDGLNFSGEAFPFLEAASAAEDEAVLGEIRLKSTDADLLYVLFTSGSTGIPKGVTISHRAIIDFTEWAIEHLHIDETTCFGNQAPFHFDASVPDIFCPLKTGATTYLIPARCFSFPKTMIRYLNEHPINTIAWVPTALINIANSGIFDRMQPINLRNIYFIGEVMPTKQLNIWQNAVPDAAYCNMYGPTEAAYTCTYYFLDRKYGDEEVLPIGKACENCRIFLINEDNEECGPGELGEIYVTGACLSNGYYNNPEKTASVFVQNPLNHLYSEIAYMTGDLARYNEFGELIFAGRKDFQIKHRGYRIELGEIETGVSAADGVEKCCCLFDKVRDDIICCYVGKAESDAILSALTLKLPQYMLPDRFVKLDAFPQTLNGKIDRVKLNNEYAR